jgi:hypothetical protein
LTFSPGSGIDRQHTKEADVTRGATEAIGRTPHEDFTAALDAWITRCFGAEDVEEDDMLHIMEEADTGRSTRYRTRYHVGRFGNRPVYFHPAEEGFTVEIDGECLLRVREEDEAQIVFNVAPAGRSGMGLLIAHCEANPKLLAAMPAALRAAIGR